IFVTYSLLGPVYAVFRPIAAFVSGILGGSAVSLLEKEDRADPGDGTGGACRCCAPKAVKKGVAQALAYGFGTLPRDINRALIVGVLIAGIIGAAVPDDYFSAFLGGGIASMLVMMIVGIPVYVCATASVPIAAALIAKGVSPGAALVFLMTGPATNAAAIFTVAKVMGGRTAAIYLASVSVSAIAGGLLLDGIYSASSAAPVVSMHWMPPEWVAVSSAVILSVVIAASFFGVKKRPEELKKDEL
ncbi:MAG: permease, partial [Dehalococcoidia bacterium]